MKNLLRTILYYLSGFSKRNNDYVVLGAWFGKRFSDNSRYVIEELKQNRDYRIIWIGEKSLKSDVENASVEFVRRNSLKSAYYLLRAGNALVSHGYQDLGTFNLMRNADVIQLWHGFPLKRIGSDNKRSRNEGIHSYENYSYFLANSKLMKERMISAFHNYGANEGNVIIAEQPRVKYLKSMSDNEDKIRSIKEFLKLPLDATIISYLPTFRDTSEKIFSFSETSNEKLDDYLIKNNIYILERQHFVREANNSINRNNIIVISERLDVQDLLLVTDLLITDYSSVYVDFLPLHKPIVHFLYDGKEYEENDRGLYCDSLIEEAGGSIIYSKDELDNFIMNKSSWSTSIVEDNKILKLIGNNEKSNIIDYLRGI